MWENGKCCPCMQKQAKMGKETTANASEMFVGLVGSGDEETNPIWNQKLHVGNCSIKFKLDNGSDISVISEIQYRKMKPTPTLEKSHAVMTLYIGIQIPSVCVCPVSVQYKKRKMLTYLEEEKPSLVAMFATSLDL